MRDELTQRARKVSGGEWAFCALHLAFATFLFGCYAIGTWMIIWTVSFSLGLGIDGTMSWWLSLGFIALLFVEHWRGNAVRVEETRPLIEAGIEERLAFRMVTGAPLPPSPSQVAAMLFALPRAAQQSLRCARRARLPSGASFEAGMTLGQALCEQPNGRLLLADAREQLGASVVDLGLPVLAQLRWAYITAALEGPRIVGSPALRDP